MGKLCRLQVEPFLRPSFKPLLLQLKIDLQGVEQLIVHLTLNYQSDVMTRFYFVAEHHTFTLHKLHLSRILWRGLARC